MTGGGEQTNELGFIRCAAAWVIRSEVRPLKCAVEEECVSLGGGVPRKPRMKWLRTKAGIGVQEKGSLLKLAEEMGLWNTLRKG